MQPDAQQPNDTPGLASRLPADVLARCADLDATIKAMVAADGDPIRQRRLHLKARRIERAIRADIRARLP